MEILAYLYNAIAYETATDPAVKCPIETNQGKQHPKLASDLHPLPSYPSHELPVCVAIAF